MNFEMPVHVGSLLFLAFFVCLEATATLSARCSQLLINAGDEMRPFSKKKKKINVRREQVDLKDYKLTL
jgi:hypothetical protein